MKKLADIHKVFFLGIGGIGMSALARYFMSLGAEVGGYDKTPTRLTDELMAEGITIVFDDAVELMPKDADLVVYTPAIPDTHLGFQYYKTQAVDLLKRSEVLGLISEDKFTIAVAGSHGKTTVSSMIAHILTDAGFSCSAFLGGIAINFNSNFVQGSSDLVVIEADEFDRSFHRLHPDMAVITAVDTDHLDIYGTKEAIDDAFVTFTEKIDETGFLVMKQGQSIEERLPNDLEKIFYSLSDQQADVYCSKYWIVGTGYLFNLMYFGKETSGYRLPIGGFHNIENAIAAISIALELKVPEAAIKKALATFKGIRRRFETILDTPKVVFIDDYAHHPEEINVFLESVKEMFPGKKITAIFQPHLFTRTRDLAAGFAQSLSKVNEVVLLDIYPARELPISGVTSQLVFDQITSNNKTLTTKEDLLSVLAKIDSDVFLTIGAGDIDKMIPAIKEMLEVRYA